ncbi:condensation domain-containing protein, partial [Polynucleobacter yangtzensis]|uniref:condensation domain-containing protein n=1 Tax=Polynucleobacter yangtzensis TaxID=1743159 RepID=UPI0012372F55
MNTQTSNLPQINDTLSNEIYPLTGAQKNVWYHQQLDPESSVYHIGAAITFHGNLDAQKLKCAWQRVFEHVDTLRLSIVLQDGIPYQKIAPLTQLNIESRDLRSDHNKEAKLNEILSHALKARIDYFQSPCFRVGIIQVSETNWVNYFIPHHLFIDGAARASILQLVSQAYDNPLQELPALVSLPEIVKLDSEYVDGENYEKDGNYWEKSLASLEAPVSISTDELGPASLSFYSTIKTTLTRKKYEQLSNLSKEICGSRAAIFATGLILYLSRLCNQKDLCIGLPTSGRNKELASFPGMMANILPLHLELNFGFTARECIQLVSQQIKDAVAHSRYPLSQISKSRRKYGLGDPFAAVLNFQSFNFDLKFAGVITAVELLNSGPISDVALQVLDRQNGLDVELIFDYNPERYTSVQAHSYLNNLRHVITELPNFLDLPIASIPLLEPSELYSVLEISGRSVTNPKNLDLTLPELFAAQVARTPEAIALVYEEQSLTYAQL